MPRWSAGNFSWRSFLCTHRLGIVPLPGVWSAAWRLKTLPLSAQRELTRLSMDIDQEHNTDVEDRNPSLTFSVRNPSRGYSNSVSSLCLLSLGPCLSETISSLFGERWNKTEKTKRLSSTVIGLMFLPKGAGSWKSVDYTHVTSMASFTVLEMPLPRGLEIP